MGSGASNLSKDATIAVEAAALIASNGDALESSLCAGVEAGLSKEPLFKQALIRLVRLGLSSLRLDAEAINKMLNDENVPVEESFEAAKAEVTHTLSAIEGARSQQRERPLMR